MLFYRHRQSKNPADAGLKKCVVQNDTQLKLLRHLQNLLCTIIQKTLVISHRHLKWEPGASEAGLILQRSMARRSSPTRSSFWRLSHLLLIGLLCGLCATLYKSSPAYRTLVVDEAMVKFTICWACYYAD